MKYFIILAALLLAAVSAQADNVIPTIPGPAEGWEAFGVCDVDTTNAEYYHYAHWTSDGVPANTEANYSTIADNIIITPGVGIEVILDNGYVVHNHKIIRIRIKGTASTGAIPAVAGIVAPNDTLGINQPSPLVSYDVVNAVSDGVNWEIDIIIVVQPQPQIVIIQIALADVTGITEAFASVCCQRPTIPSMTTYGLGVLVVLILASGYFALRRRRAMVH